MQDFEARAKTVKWLIIITAAISILSPLLSFFLQHMFALAGPVFWLPLSLVGIEKGYVWQVVTCLFVHSAETKIALSFLISLGFMMFLLWFAGKEIAMRFGALKFLLLYFTAGIAGSLVSLLWLYFTNSKEIIFGSSSSVFALLVVWAMLFRDLRLHYFTMIRIQAGWLIGILIGIPLLIHLSQGQVGLFIYNAVAIVWGYFFGRYVFKLPPLFHKKIVDIRKYQKEESDEEFMDRMLTKISQRGPGSLTDKERDRMDSISRKRR